LIAGTATASTSLTASQNGSAPTRGCDIQLPTIPK
jgi:hypothetical protein